MAEWTAGQARCQRDASGHCPHGARWPVWDFGVAHLGSASSLLLQCASLYVLNSQKVVFNRVELHRGLSRETQRSVADGWKMDFGLTLSKLSEKRLERSEMSVDLWFRCGFGPSWQGRSLSSFIHNWQECMQRLFTSPQTRKRRARQ